MKEKDNNWHPDQIARMRMLAESKEKQGSYISFHDFHPDDLPICCGIQMSDEDMDALRTAMDTSDLNIEISYVDTTSECTSTGVLTNSYPEGMTLETQDCLQTLIGKVVRWHYDRNLIEGSTDKDQTLKLAQELGELSDSVCKGKDIRDDIGDMLVVMLNITERNGVSLAECLKKAWDDIKDRKGCMVDGVFVKEGDL